MAWGQSCGRDWFKLVGRTIVSLFCANSLNKRFMVVSGMGSTCTSRGASRGVYTSWGSRALIIPSPADSLSFPLTILGLGSASLGWKLLLFDREVILSMTHPGLLRCSATRKFHCSRLPQACPLKWCRCYPYLEGHPIWVIRRCCGHRRSPPNQILRLQANCGKNAQIVALVAPASPGSTVAY